MSYQQPYGQQPYGQQPYGQQPYWDGQELPSTYLAWSIGSLVGSIFCCQLALIPAIVAVVYSSQVESKFHMGDYYGAENASKNARIWVIVTFAMIALTVVAWVVWLALFIFSQEAAV